MDVLLVEDNPSDVRILKDLLEDMRAAMHIHWVIDGYEALDYVFQRNDYQDARSPDIILLDLGLPRIDGYQVLKQLKQHVDYHHIPILILTTSRNPLDRSQCKQLGSDGFLSKPHNLKGYEELVQQLVRFDFPQLVQKRA